MSDERREGEGGGCQDLDGAPVLCDRVCCIVEEGKDDGDSILMAGEDEREVPGKYSVWRTMRLAA